MNLHLHPTRWTTKLGIAALALMIAAGALLYPAPAQAHCDSVNGPVVEAARTALAQKDINLILPYIQADGEAELTAAFEHTVAVRGLGPEARQLADQYFFETAVRLHRLGEGAGYTGLKEAADFGPALEAAEAALVDGAVDEVYSVLEEALRHEVTAKFEAIETARAHAEEEQTVEANRARVQAELGFETYVYDLYTAIVAQDVHSQDGHSEVATEADTAEPAHSH